MTNITAKDIQDASSNSHQIINNAKKRKIENCKHSLSSSGENSTDCKGHNFTNLCKSTAINDEHLQPCSDVVLKGLNFSKLLVSIQTYFCNIL